MLVWRASKRLRAIHSTLELMINDLYIGGATRLWRDRARARQGYPERSDPDRTDFDAALVFQGSVCYLSKPILLGERRDAGLRTLVRAHVHSANSSVYKTDLLEAAHCGVRPAAHRPATSGHTAGAEGPPSLAGATLDWYDDLSTPHMLAHDSDVCPVPVTRPVAPLNT